MNSEDDLHPVSSSVCEPEPEASDHGQTVARRPGGAEQSEETPSHLSLSSRSIRSFVVRNGRMTDAQTAALTTLLPRIGVPFEPQLVDTQELFGRSAPIWLEIGFGNGDALAHMAKLRPDTDFLGIEVHAPGVGHALRTIDKLELANVRVIQHDALDVLEHMITPGSIDLIALYFPDPWHKKRHHKRRIVQDTFLSNTGRALKPGGLLHCATDWADYANWMLEHLDAAACFRNTAGQGGFAEQPAWRASTRFERRGERLGHEVHDLLYERIDIRS